MKKTKIIIPALGVLLLSTAASVTGTVAWFSMNKTVTATGMSVTAKSDSSFLLIGNEDDDLDSIQDANSISATAKNSTKELYPVAHKAIANTAAADSISNWYFMYSDDPDNYIGTATEELAIPNGKLFTDYVLKNTFKITVAKQGHPVNNLKVDTLTISGVSAVRALVTSSTAAQEFAETYADDPAVDTDDATILAAQVTSSTVVEINVYIFWDGNDELVYTNNADQLTNTSVELTFTYESVSTGA